MCPIILLYKSCLYKLFMLINKLLWYSVELYVSHHPSISIYVMSVQIVYVVTNKLLCYSVKLHVSHQLSILVLFVHINIIFILIFSSPIEFNKTIPLFCTYKFDIYVKFLTFSTSISVWCFCLLLPIQITISNYMNNFKVTINSFLP